MTDCESILVQISELVFTEMEAEVKSVTHGTKEKGTENSFVILTNDDREFTITINQK